MDQSLVWYICGISQYIMPKVRKPFQPRAPVCTWAMV